MSVFTSILNKYEIQFRIKAQKEASKAFEKEMGQGASEIICKLTLIIITISGGLKNNMVPGKSSFQADIRLPVEADLNQVNLEI